MERQKRKVKEKQERTTKKKTVQRVKKRMWKQKEMTKKRMENDREVDRREERQADGLQWPGADLTMWFVKQIAGLTEKNLSQQNVLAVEQHKKGWGQIDERDDWINWKASKLGEFPKGSEKQPVELEGNGEQGEAFEWLGYNVLEGNVYA